MHSTITHRGSKDGILFDLRLGDQIKTVLIRVPVAFIMNDGKSADMLTGRYGSYSMGRVSRACYCSFQNLSNTKERCKYVVHHRIQKLQTTALGSGEMQPTLTARNKAINDLKALSIHVFANAFDDVCFGRDERGIFGCTPTDLMHAFLEGVLRHAMRAIFAALKPSKKADLDALVDEVVRHQRSSSRTLFPRTNFKKGFSNLSLLTASEWLGVCFTLLLTTMMDRGRVILASACQNNMDDDEDTVDESGNSNDVSDSEEELTSTDEEDEVAETKKPSSSKRQRTGPLPCSINSLREVLEALLCFYSWTKREHCYNLSTPSRQNDTRASIARLLTMVKTRLPRAGNGWNLQKFHDLMHLTDDMIRFGSPRNTDAGCGERSLKVFAKQPARTAQKRDDVFLEQLTNRLHESDMLATMKRITDPVCQWAVDCDDLSHLSASTSLSPSASSSCLRDDQSMDGFSAGDGVDLDELSSVNPCLLIGKHRFTITFSETGTACLLEERRKMTKGYVSVHPVILKWFENDRKHRKYANPLVHLWTEARVADGACLRAHPNYRSGGEWYDWCIVKIPESSTHQRKPKTTRKKRKSPDIICPAKPYASLWIQYH